MSLQLKKIRSSGNLVSDKILNQIISSKLIVILPCKVYLDGYPRTLARQSFYCLFLNQNISFDLIFDFEN